MTSSMRNKKAGYDLPDSELLRKVRGVFREGKKYADTVLGQINDACTCPEDLEETMGVPYEGYDGTELYMDIYRRKDADGKLPVVILFHCGGLYVLDPRVERPFCEITSRMGFLVFSLPYSRIGEHEDNAAAILSDACAGLDKAASLIEEYGGNPEQVFVGGNSAGAFPALYATAACRSARLCDALHVKAPDLDVLGFFSLFGMIYTHATDLIGAMYGPELFEKHWNDRRFMRFMNPEEPEIIRALPPVLLVSSSGDFIRHYTLRYSRVLRRAGHSRRLLYFPGSSVRTFHTFPTTLPCTPESAAFFARFRSWIYEHCRSSQEGRA